MPKASRQATPIRRAIESQLKSLADPERAVQQQAYMKSSMPYAGLIAPVQKQMCKEIYAEYPFTAAEDWIDSILDLWRQAKVRETRYAAIHLFLLPRYRKAWLTPDCLGVLREMIETGAWWDYVDNLAVNGMGHLLRQYPEQMKPMVRTWGQDDNLWIRRTAILSQLKFKQDTDERLLFETIMGSISDNDFFARKAIGWALRQYSRTAPDAVIDFITQHKDQLSGLSKREGLRILVKQGIAVPNV